MSNFVRIENNQIKKYPYTYFDLISEYPGSQAHLPLSLIKQIELGVFVVVGTEKPEADLEDYVEVNPVNELGVWRQSWQKVDLTPIQVAERIERQWERVRSRRNEMLQETDQTQLPDRPIDEDLRLAYADYRQSLRDITLQPDPFNIEWPERPE
jgi:hypothetical protein